MSVMSVVSVMKGLHLIDQTVERINYSDENTSLSVMSVINVISVTSIVRALLYLFDPWK